MTQWNILLRGAVVIFPPGVLTLHDDLVLPPGCAVVDGRGGERVVVEVVAASEAAVVHLRLIEPVA
ncbi:MAG: hypothetical protein ACKVQR_04520 [Aquabacterium sp.]